MSVQVSVFVGGSGRAHLFLRVGVCMGVGLYVVEGGSWPGQCLTRAVTQVCPASPQ